MARQSSKSEKNDDQPKFETVELVAPDGVRKRTVIVGSLGETQLRFEGYLPAEQASLDAPEAPDSGSSVLTGAENTVGTNA